MKYTDPVDVCICSSDVYLASFCSQQTGTFRPQSFHPKLEMSQRNCAYKASVSVPVATKGAEFGSEESHRGCHSLFGGLGPSHLGVFFVYNTGAYHGNYTCLAEPY